MRRVELHFSPIFLPAASRRSASSIPCLYTVMKESHVVARLFHQFSHFLFVTTQERLHRWAKLYFDRDSWMNASVNTILDDRQSV